MSRYLNRVIKYFDLQSRRRGTATAFDSSQNLTVIPQYISLVLGIAAQPFLINYQVSGVWMLSFESVVSRIIFATFVGLIVFPGVYRSAFDDGKPKFLQFCSIFALGIGWKALFASAIKVTGM